jgi:serine/threonine protein kinase
MQSNEYLVTLLALEPSFFPQVCKISDFGLSRIKNESVTKISGMLGTPGWSAPEIYKQEKYTEKVDMYSFGVVLRCDCVLFVLGRNAH